MKCIKYYSKFGGLIHRVSDDMAANEVRSGKAMYCPKHWWKSAKLAEVTQ